MSKAVIMAGGQGERFWPLTHKDFPKYRLRFDGKRSLLQGTFERLTRVYGRDNVYVVTTAPHAKMIRQELPGLKSARIFIEPFRNNTCAALSLSCALLEKQSGPQETVSFFPADHLIKDEVLFKKTLRRSMALAKAKPLLVTIGIRPTFPAIGYGYIQRGSKVGSGLEGFKVRRFVEKPDRRTAKKYLQSGQYFWNAGMFTWRLGVFREALRRHCPAFVKDLDLKRLSASYKKLPNVSIDFALMEKAKNIAVVPTRMDWCDMGSWDMLFERSLLDKDKNYARGFYYRKEARNTLILNETSRPVVALGVTGLIVVQTPRGTLICPRGRSEEAALLSKKL